MLCCVRKQLVTTAIDNCFHLLSLYGAIVHLFLQMQSYHLIHTREGLYAYQFVKRLTLDLVHDVEFCFQLLCPLFVHLSILTTVTPVMHEDMGFIGERTMTDDAVQLILEEQEYQTL